MTRRGRTAQLGRQIPEGLVIAFFGGIFLAVALPAFQDARAAGQEVWRALLYASLFGIGGIFAGVIALFAFVGALMLFVESRWPKVGRKVKVPHGRYKGQRALVEAMPDNNQLITMRLLSTGQVLRVPEWEFKDEDCAWMKPGVRVKVAGSYDLIGRIEEHDADTHAVLVLPDGASEGIWLSPNLLTPL